MAKKVRSDSSVDHQMKMIGERVRELRRQKNQNYEAWSYLNGINKVSLNRIERGENVTMKMLLEILKKLDVSVQDFFKDIR
ncbi:MAG: helix-turn-helix transcriptional regulator [Bacteroidales bacterium]